MKRFRKLLFWLGVVPAFFLLVALAGAVFVARSAWFQNQVKQRIVTIVENATGGRVEIGRFRYDWSSLTASVAPFVLHGTERVGDPPLLRAEKVEIGLRVISMLERQVDLKFLTVERPQVHIVVDRDGRTNVPAPKLPLNPASLVQDLLKIRVQQFTLRNGMADYNGRQIPLEASAHDVDAGFRYRAQGPAYVGEIGVRSLRIDAPAVRDSAFEAQASIALSPAGLDIQSARFTMGKSSIEATGRVEDFASPHGTFDLKALLRPADMNRSFLIPLADAGELRFNGKLDVRTGPAFDWELRGNANGKGLGFHNRSLDITNASLTTPLQLRANRLDLAGFLLAANEGTVRGKLSVAEWSRIAIDGEARGVSVQGKVRASGPVHLTTVLSRAGFRDTQASGNFTLEPAPGVLPILGFADAAYDQSAGTLSLSNSAIQLPSSHLEIAGTLGQTLTVHAVSRDANDVLGVAPLLGLTVPATPAFALKGGSAKFDGTISGPLDNPRIAGQAEVTKFAAEGQDFDRLTADFDATRDGIAARSLAVSQGAFHLTGKLQLGLQNWRPVDASPLAASITLRGAEIRRLLEDRGYREPITGVLAATAEVKGTWGVPLATAGIDAENLTAYQEHADRVRASVIVTGAAVQVVDAHVVAGAARVDGKGSYERTGSDWKTGRARFDLTGRGVSLAQIKHLQDRRKDIGGSFDVNAQGTARMNNGEFRVETITSETNVRDITFEGKRYGTLNVSANNHGAMLDIQANATLLNTALHGSGEWKLEGDDPGQGQIVIPRLTVATLHQLLPVTARKDLPFEGYVEGRIDVNGPLRKPDQLKAEVQLSTLQINATAGSQPRAGAQARDLVLRNAKPILLTATTKALEIRSAQLVGTDTSIEAHGRYAFESKAPYDFQVNGSINLAILQLFNPDLLASGAAVVDAAIRGPFAEPQVEGKMELKKASLYVNDLPNGLDNANGVIVFDRNRATVDSLSATTGGGNVAIQKGSFVGFRGPSLQYRMQGSADHVRYRSPEGVSITVNSQLSLIGTSENALLAGTVTVIRAGFNPTTDVGNILASTTKPVSAPATPNSYLKGIQFDVRVESAQALEIQTSLTRNIEAEVNLRVRGTPDRPVVQGQLNVNEGEIEFFGNRYRINRGNVNFYNAVKIEPIVDMDLETQVRGITVDISFTGPLSKLNFSYRSDPPLQTNDIIALLAVGRTPLSTGAVAASPSAATNTTYLGVGNNALLQQAVTAPVAGRLQRFFGVSHIKIDPQLTDVTSVPQARLTLEQQISKDITLTYITNLTRTQEQIVRVEWDLDRHWSVIALRDENGAFGIDFQYRKRFK
jgi:translocation and assembly module TamB